MRKVLTTLLWVCFMGTVAFDGYYAGILAYWLQDAASYCSWGWNKDSFTVWTMVNGLLLLGLFGPGAQFIYLRQITGK